MIIEIQILINLIKLFDAYLFSLSSISLLIGIIFEARNWFNTIKFECSCDVLDELLLELHVSLFK